jgi:hypothetical protein
LSRVTAPIHNRAMKRLRRGIITAMLASTLAAAGCGSDSDSTTATSRSTTTTTTTTTTTQPASAQPAVAVWPFADSSTRYTDPVEAAKGFALDYLGFVDPVVGPFVVGGKRSGEVAIQPRSSGPVTTIAVRRLATDDTWWVLAASTPDLQLQAPMASATITSPVTVSGVGTAFEGTINVAIREDGTVAPVTTDFVMGGGNGEMGPFSKPISFNRPVAASGAMLLSTRSAENGNIQEATVTRVRFG